MKKLGLNVLQKMINQKLTSAEIDFLLYVSVLQNVHGTAEGIYYRDMCESLGFSWQTFYAAKAGLVKKGIIRTEKMDYSDHDITIMDNDFSNPESFKNGYLNTGYSVFQSQEFRNLTGGEKLLFLDLAKNCLASGQSWWVGTGKFFAVYTEKLGICRRTAQEYLKRLRMFFSIGVKDKKYYFTLKKAAREKNRGSEEDGFRKNTVAVAIRRNKIDNVKIEEIKKLEELLTRYSREIRDSEENVSLSCVIKESLRILNPAERHKKRKILKPNLVHRILRKMLGLEVRTLPYNMA